MILPDYVLAWTNRAEDHFRAAETLKRRQPPLCDHVCYHARETAEKYLTAYLLLRGVCSLKGQELARLLDRVLAPDLPLENLREDVLALDSFDLNLLYPGVQATAEDARLAMRSVRRVRKALRNALGLESAA